MVSGVVAILLLVCDLSQSNRRQQQPEQPERSIMSVSLGHFPLTVGSSSQPSSRSAPPLCWRNNPPSPPRVAQRGRRDDEWVQAGNRLGEPARSGGRTDLVESTLKQIQSFTWTSSSR